MFLDLQSLRRIKEVKLFSDYETKTVGEYRKGERRTLKAHDIDIIRKKTEV